MPNLNKLSLVLISALLAFALSGCGGGDDDDNQPETVPFALGSGQLDNARFRLQ